MKSRSDYYKDWVDGNSDLTSYVIQTEQDKIKERITLELSQADAEAMVKAIETPAPCNKRLTEAAKRHKELLMKSN